MSGKRRDSRNRILRSGEMTVEQLVRKYLLQKTGVRHNTEIIFLDTIYYTICP